MIRAVLFDLDRTLLDRDRSFARFAESQFARFRPRLEGIDRTEFVDTLIRLDARGAVWKDHVYQQLVLDLGIAAIPWEELFNDFDTRISDHYLPFPHLRETLSALAKDYRLGLVTNGRTAFQNRTISTLGIGPFFGTILISESEGLRKPDPEIFRRALLRLDVSAGESVFVGDHPVSDIDAARRCGLRTVWMRNEDFTDVTCDAAIDDLSELPERIRRLG